MDQLIKRITEELDERQLAMLVAVLVRHVPFAQAFRNADYEKRRSDEAARFQAYQDSSDNHPRSMP